MVGPNFIGDPSHYRIKPEMMKMVVKGWVCISAYDCWHKGDVRSRLAPASKQVNWVSFETAAVYHESPES